VCDGPEPAKRMMDQGDCGAFGWSDGPTAAQKVDLEIGIDPAAQMECQMEVQQGGGRARAYGCALFLKGLGPSHVGVVTGGAAKGGILVGDLTIQDNLSSGIIADLFVGQQRDQALLEGSKAAFDFSFGCGLGAARWVTPRAEKARWNSGQGSRSSDMESWPKRLRPSV
jgi:hypothetical protein